MKIGDLVRITGVSKETIHYYIRKGVLPRPRKAGKNKADYGGHYVDKIRLIRALRRNYFLPISVIKKLMEKQNSRSPEERVSFEFITEFIRPLDQLLYEEVEGRRAFMAATGISGKWLDKMEQWGIITGENRSARHCYARDDVIIGKLLVDMERAGLGPRDGFNPEDLRQMTDVLRDFVARNVGKRAENLSDSGHQQEEPFKSGSGVTRTTEIMSLFFYHIYRKIAKEEYQKLCRQKEKAGTQES
ncbi:MAG: MerR family transcriptional regulator [Desulfosalsimonas sp.]